MNRQDFFGGDPDDACYEECEAKHATVATNISSHSIQVFGVECEDDEDGPCAQVIGLGGNEPCLVQGIVFSAEQFRESGTYKRVEQCPDFLNINLAHDRVGGKLSMFGDFKNHFLYKPKGSENSGPSGGCCGGN